MRRNPIHHVRRSVRAGQRSHIHHVVSFLGWRATAVPSATDGVQGAAPEHSGAAPGDPDGNDTVRFGPGALNANEYDGSVNVNRNSAENLSVPNGNEGGRALVAVYVVSGPMAIGPLWCHGSRPMRLRVAFRHPPSLLPIS